MAKRARTGSAGRVEPWWLEGADADCSHCLQTYAFGLHFHCAGCDGAVCNLCVVSVEARAGEARCPQCAEPEDG